MSGRKYKATIGLEVHAQLSTKTKMFCGCSTEYGNEPNTQTCPVCLGLPGALPVTNEKAVEYAVRMGHATHCRINPFSVFARKNYFYQDLPKGYQISQYDKPICEEGYIEIEPEEGIRKRIGITRIHLEEDAGKSIHDAPGAVETHVDFNRSGVPLIEIVSEPDIETPEEAYAYLVKIRQYVQYLGICDGNMEEGSLRCDANVSVRPEGQKEFGTRTEVKNMNSFRNVEKALKYEIRRQIELLESGGKVVQQTLLWDANANEARPMRSKEESDDYRYFPEPDLVPLNLPADMIERIRNELPELPEAKRKRLMETYGIPAYDAALLTDTAALAKYFEETTAICGDGKLVANWIMTEVLRVLKEEKISIEEFTIRPGRLGSLCNLILKKTISGKIAKDIFAHMLESEETPEEIVKTKGLEQVSDDSAIRDAVLKALDDNPAQLQQYLGGKDKLFGFFVGQVMKATRGKANPVLVNEILKEELSRRK